MSLKSSPAPHIFAKDSTRSLMRDVLLALLPTSAAAIWFFGPGAALRLLLGVVSAVLFEFLYQKLTRQAVRVGDLSAAVTGLLLALNLPSGAPLWLPVIGSFLAIVLVKQLFGGIGDNFINPALAARAILMASWPARMNAFTAPTYWSGADAVSAATPLALADSIAAATGAASATSAVPAAQFSAMDLFLGKIPGVMGEVCKAAILLGFLYLLVRRVISWRIPVVLTVTFAVCMSAFGYDPLESVLTGGLLFGAVFMATDYTTSPMSVPGQFLYAALAGLIIAVIRAFGSYPEGVTYGILLVNIATPLIDKYIKPRVYGHGKEAKADA